MVRRETLRYSAASLRFMYPLSLAGVMGTNASRGQCLAIWRANRLARCRRDSDVALAWPTRALQEAHDESPLDQAA